MTSITAVFIAACYAFPLTDTDIWWHLASGRWMVNEGRIPRIDPFCFSSSGEPWIDLHWGFQAVSYAFWSWGGPWFLIAWKCLSMVGAWTLAAGRRLNAGTLPLLCLLGIFLAYHTRYLVDLRPIFITLLGLAAILQCLERARLGPKLGWAWWALLVQVLLVNTQGLFPVTTVSATLMALGLWAQDFFGKRGLAGSSLPPPPEGAVRRVSMLAMCLWAVCFLNPYGLQGFLLPYKLFGRIQPEDDNIWSQHISENIPLLQLWGEKPLAFLAYVWMAFIFFASFDQARRRLRLDHVLLLGAFAYLAWMAERNVPLFALVGFFVFARNWDVSRKARASEAVPLSASGAQERGAVWGLPAAWSVLLLILGVNLVRSQAYHLPGNWATPFRFPSLAVDFLKKNPVEGPIFNELRYGGYISFHLFPEKKCFVDGRMVLHDAEFFRDFLAVLAEPERFEDYRQRHGFSHVLLPIAEFKSYIPLLVHLWKQKGWYLLFSDGASVLLARDEAHAGQALHADGIVSKGASHPILENIRRRFGSNPLLQDVALANTAVFLAAAGEQQAAEKVLSFCHQDGCRPWLEPVLPVGGGT